MDATARLGDDGFVVLRDVFESALLSDEFDHVLRAAFHDATHRNNGPVENRFRYVPAMSRRTPVSLALSETCSRTATMLLGTAVLPGRAKCTEYHDATGSHRDSELAIRSLGFLAYLEPLTADTGALRVLPGSHRGVGDTAIGTRANDEAESRFVTVTTMPGDIIVMDEHLLHASVGGTIRRQWRVDFVADEPPHSEEPHSHAADTNDPDKSDVLRRYFAGQYSAGWDGGYDVDLFPSYGPDWRTLYPHWSERLCALGVYDAVEAEEAFSRAARRR